MEERVGNSTIWNFLDKELARHGLRRWYHTFEYGVLRQSHFIEKVEEVPRRFWIFRWTKTRQTTVAKILSEPHAPKMLHSGDLEVQMLVDDEGVRRAIRGALQKYESRFGLKAILIS